MAFQTTQEIKNAFMASHPMEATVTVLRGDVSLGEIPFVNCRVSATYGTRGGRDGELLVDRNVIDAGFLNPLTDQVLIRTGIPNVIQVPIFTGRPDTQNASSEGLVSVPLLSRGGEVVRAAFETPWAVSTPYLSTNEIIKIIQDVDSAWAVDVSAATPRPIPTDLVGDEDRGQMLDQIAQGASQVWQPDRTGGFVVYDNPYSIGPSLASASVITLRDGEDGCLVTVDAAKSREGIYNSVTVVVERLNNTEPIRVTARDTLVGSPTMWGGLFGKQNLVVKNQTPISQAEASQLALRILRQSLALQRSWRITVPHMPLLDPGDVFVLWYRDEVTAQVVEGVEYSCRADDSTVITSRELTLADATLSLT